MYLHRRSSFWLSCASAMTRCRAGVASQRTVIGGDRLQRRHLAHCVLAVSDVVADGTRLRRVSRTPPSRRTPAPQPWSPPLPSPRPRRDHASALQRCAAKRRLVAAVFRQRAQAARQQSGAVGFHHQPVGENAPQQTAYSSAAGCRSWPACRRSGFISLGRWARRCRRNLARGSAATTPRQSSSTRRPRAKPRPGSLLGGTANRCFMSGLSSAHPQRLPVQDVVVAADELQLVVAGFGGGF